MVKSQKSKINSQNQKAQTHNLSLIIYNSKSVGIQSIKKKCDHAGHHRHVCDHFSAIDKPAAIFFKV